MISLSWPLIHQYTGLESSIFFKNIFFFVSGLIILSLSVGLAAGSYPAFYLSSFQPMYNLKDSKIGKISSKFRNTLVVVQFVISISLIGCTGIIFNQLNYLQNKNPGFKKDNIIVVPYEFESSTRSVKSLKNDMLARPEILCVTTSYSIPGEKGGRQNLFVPEGSTPENAPIINATYVDSDFLPTMKIELIKGRNFSNEYPNDPKESIIINETAAKRFGWENPIGKKVTELIDDHPTKTIIGVVKDYHFFPLYAEIMPLIIENEENGENNHLNYFLVSIAPDNIKESVSYIQPILENNNSPLPYRFFFLDKNFNSHYNSEMQLSLIFSCFTIIAIFLACLGLFGLAAYTSEQRTKEIGIRKVVGATVNSIVFMLTKDFVKWVLVANIIAWPVSYYFMNSWLQNFAFRINISWWMFVISGTIALLIALVTISFQAIKAATANPVDSLKYE